jgi:putative hydrolase of the HAD superfamily
MSRLRAVLFDAGGTLIHPDHEFILARLRAQGVARDVAAYESARRHAQAVVGDLLRSPAPGDDASRARAWFVALLTRLGLPPDRLGAVGESIRERHREGRLWVRPVPGTREMLGELRSAGLALGVVSNADGRVVDYLEAAGLGGCFDLVLDSALVGIEKPDPRIFGLACARLGVAPGEAVHVGDTYEVDVLGARAAGISAVLVADEPRPDVPTIPEVTRLPAVLGLVAASGPGDGDGAAG